MTVPSRFSERNIFHLIRFLTKMAKINTNFLDLQNRYLFSEIASRVNAYAAANPAADIIRMGIGDVTLPLVPAVIEAMHKAVDECASAETFHGYGPEHGYAFLREAICKGDYYSRSVMLSPDEIFISDGAKSDTGNIGDLFATCNKVGITDPVYPVYVDTNVMGGKSIHFIPCGVENGFMGDIPDTALDIVYLCFPNNPTGAVATREKLAEWVNYALANNCIIMYDSAYEAFIRDADIPHSIYEIPGAERCAIEFRSFSKTAGFTGIRCGYTVVPKALKCTLEDGTQVSLNALWERRQSCKFNGASYISQRAAEAVYTPEGRAQVKASVDYYLGTASIIREGMQRAGLECIGGQNAPYIWARTPVGMPSWDFFDLLLNKASVVVTPGAGFGQAGEGWFRLTAFADRERSREAVERIIALVKTLK